MRSSTRLLTAVLACALALAGCGSRPSDGTSSGTDTSSADRTTLEQVTPTPATGIPDDFPLSAGMGGPGDTIPTSRTGTGLRDLELCGTSPLRGLGTRDRMIADNSGGEALHTRELVLLGSPEEAAQVARAYAGLADDCDRTTSSRTRTTTEVRDSPFGAAPAAVLVQGFDFAGEPGAGHVVVHVVPVGAALLVTQMYGEWPDVTEGIDRTTALLADVVDAMSLFAQDDASAVTTGDLE